MDKMDGMDKNGLLNGQWTMDEGLLRPCPVRVPSVSRPCPVRVPSVFMQISSRPAAFLDRDGTLIADVPYLKNPEEVVVPSEVIEGLHLLRKAGFLLIIISNQSGIARGYFTEDDLAAVHARMEQLLLEGGIELDGYYYCPHAPDSCCCRKPATGMLEQACLDFSIDLSRSCMIGDNDCDMQLAKNFKIPGLLLESKRETNRKLPTRICSNFLEAARLAVSGIE
jgi:D-glycero-D-manno-heptose 1,7-bisphosphate phosphatase